MTRLRRGPTGRVATQRERECAGRRLPQRAMCTRRDTMRQDSIRRGSTIGGPSAILGVRDYDAFEPLSLGFVVAAVALPRAAVPAVWFLGWITSPGGVWSTAGVLGVGACRLLARRPCRSWLTWRASMRVWRRSPAPGAVGRGSPRLGGLHIAECPRLSTGDDRRSLHPMITLPCTRTAGGTCSEEVVGGAAARGSKRQSTRGPGVSSASAGTGCRATLHPRVSEGLCREH